MDGSSAGAARAAADAAASAATVCAFYAVIGGSQSDLCLHDKVCTVAAEEATPAAASAAALAAAPTADPWIHGSTSFIMKHICHYEIKNKLASRRPIQNHALIYTGRKAKSSNERMNE